MTDPLKFFMLQPQTILAAQLNLPAATFPLLTLPYDNVTTGNPIFVQPGMTLALGSAPGLQDYGRQRVKWIEFPAWPSTTTGVIHLGITSDGFEDGMLHALDNAYITVYDDFRVWSKISYIAPAGDIFKDGDIVVSTSTTQPPPVANAGPPAIGTIDPVTGVLLVQFPAYETPASFAVADGATIVSQYWWLPTGVSLVAGFSLNSPLIQVNATPGHHYMNFTVVDSNDKTHTTWTWILAIDPDADISITDFGVSSHVISPEGQELTVRVWEEIPESLYPDGTLVALWEGESSLISERDNLRFWGWHVADPARIEAGRTGIARNVDLQCVDVAGRLKMLPGWSVALMNEVQRVVEETPSITWSYMTNPNIDKFLHYLLHWHSTALEVTDWSWMGTGGNYQFTVLEASGDSLYAQVDRKAKSIVPNHRFTCDRHGKLAITVDPMLQVIPDRTAVVQVTLTAADWSSLGYTRHRTPRANWLWTSAIVAAPDVVVPVFSRAPGESPGQGLDRVDRGELLARSQHELNVLTGHLWGRMTARQTNFEIELPWEDDTDFEPAHLEWVVVNIPAEVAAQRGFVINANRGLVQEMRVNYRHDRTGTVRTVTLTWERETASLPGVTYVPPEAEDVDSGNDYWAPPAGWVPPLPGDTRYYYGDPAGYILWDGARVFRTWDILAASPTWELVDTGITGEILDGLYVHVDATTVGMWLMTADGIWWCGDIMATTPSWSLTLTLATVRAAEEQQATKPTIFYAMNNYASEPGYLIVVTAPGLPASTLDDYNYSHAYSWHTHDYGATWTHVDMNGFLETAAGYISGYAWCGRYSIAIYASSPVIWIARGTSRAHNDTAIFKSLDLGDTWSKEYSLVDNSVSPTSGPTLFAPFPDYTHPSYMTRADFYGAEWPWLYTSTNAWATATQQLKITDYRGLVYGLNVNSNTFQPSHVLAWWHRTVDGKAVLFESSDAGVTWAQLYDPDRLVVNVQIPNGWPPNVDLWFDVLMAGSTSFAMEVIRSTSNRFATTQDRRGNLATLVASWTAGTGNGGYALPRVAPNV